MESDRRRRQRAPLDIFLNKITGGVRHMVRSHDISERGILIRRLIEPDDLGRECDLEFRLPGHPETIWARARIIWDEETDAFGLQFIAISDPHREVIRTFVVMNQDWREELRGV